MACPTAGDPMSFRGFVLFKKVRIRIFLVGSNKLLNIFLGECS